MSISAPYFWSRVAVGRSRQCWPWRQATFPFGYGIAKLNGRAIVSHRYAWMVQNGPIPKGLCVLHRCDNPPCCNPAHLFLGTKTDNSRDCYLKGRLAKGERSGAYTHPEKVGKGEKNGRALLSNEQIIEMRSLFDDGAMACPMLALRFGVSKAQAWRICKRIAWKHL